MEVQVVDNRANIVQVNTAIGSFRGLWCSPVPIISKRYIVELDCDDILIPENIELSTTSKPHIDFVDQTIYITGLVEEIEDSVMILRLQESLMMLSISSDFDFMRYIGHYVRIRINEIKLYDTGIC